MKNYYLIKTSLILICYLTISSCKKEKNEEDYYWLQTKCSDPWKTGENDSDNKVKTSVINFLENEDIKVFDISINHDQTTFQYCEACDCTNGTRIIVNVDNEEKIKALGFKKY